MKLNRGKLATATSNSPSPQHARLRCTTLYRSSITSGVFCSWKIFSMTNNNICASHSGIWCNFRATAAVSNWVNENILVAESGRQPISNWGIWNYHNSVNSSALQCYWDSLPTRSCLPLLGFPIFPHLWRAPGQWRPTPQGNRKIWMGRKLSSIAETRPLQIPWF